MGDEAGSSTIHDVLATEPVIRRVVAARVTNPADVDDLVHDCLERLLVARHRLAPETVLPYSVVTAQNLVFSQARTAARRTARLHRSFDLGEADRPEDEVLAGEARVAMQVSLSQLSERDRADLLTYQEIGTGAAEAHPDESSGAMRVRMGRTRAKLRLEYLLAFRRVTLPSPMCRSVLLAISGGDTRRQRALQAGDHLLQCETCAELHEPLAKRSLALTAIVFPVVAAAWLASKVRSHPLSSAATTGTVVAAAVVGAVLVHPASGTSPRLAVPKTAVPVTAGPVPAVPVTAVPVPATTPTTVGPGGSRPATWLSVGGSGLTFSGLRGDIGRSVTSPGALVEEVVSHNGFWVGTGTTDRVWVQLVGPLRSLRVVKGDRLRFAGAIVANTPSFLAQAGLSRGTGAAQLTAQGAHIALPTTAVHIIAPEASGK